MAYEYYTAMLQLIGHKDHMVNLTDKSILLEELEKEKRSVYELSKTWNISTLMRMNKHRTLMDELIYDLPQDSFLLPCMAFFCIKSPVSISESVVVRASLNRYCHNIGKVIYSYTNEYQYRKPYIILADHEDLLGTYYYTHFYSVERDLEIPYDRFDLAKHFSTYELINYNF
jgi:hypothetical protein